MKYADTQRDSTLEIDPGTHGNFWPALDIVREGLKRMVNNHEFPAQEEWRATATILFLDEEAAARKAMEEQTREQIAE